MMNRLRAWLDRWGAILPLLVAEFVVWLGFGGLLPVLPIYFEQQGLDLATLGLVIAAWPAARLLSEPFFGWLADRTARVPLMVIGLVATGVFGALPLVLTGPLAFFVLRAGAGLGAAIYDPAARGFLTDSTPPDRRGEAFGLYGAAQMGGLLIGPSIGAFGADRFGGIAFVFVFSAIAAIVAAVGIALRVREEGPAHKADASPSSDRTTMPPDSPYVEGRAAAALAADRVAAGDGPTPTTSRTMRLLNRGLVAAIILNVGGYYGGGTYEVIWSLFLQGLGADLALIGLTFAMFGLPVLVLSPYAGRTGRQARVVRVHRDRHGPARRDRHPVHAHAGPVLRGPAHPHRGDRVRIPEPGAVRGGRRELAAGPIVDRPGTLRCGRDARLHHRVGHDGDPGGAEHPAALLFVQRRDARDARDRGGRRRRPAPRPRAGTRAGPGTCDLMQVTVLGGAVWNRMIHVDGLPDAAMAVTSTEGASEELDVEELQARTI